MEKKKMEELNNRELENVTGGESIPAGLTWKHNSNRVSVVQDNCGMTVTSNGKITKLGYFYVNGVAKSAVYIKADRTELSAWFEDQVGSSYNYMNRLNASTVTELCPQ